jgi:flagellar hook-basal body complex protein FliE
MMLPIQGFPVTSIDINPLRPAAPAAKDGGFASTLEDAFDNVESLQANADQKVSALLDGNGQDIHSAMIAVERADLSFQLMLQVRNKIVNAYQEVARMQF